MSDQFTALQVTHHDHHVEVRLNRPEVRNAIDQTMVDELHAVCAELERMPKILLIAGAPADAQSGRAAVFASGADITQLRERRREDALTGINSTVFERIARLPLPVIALIDGYALGGGAELAYAADFRIGTAEVRLGNPETSLGIAAAAGASWRLKELVGEALAKQILLAGRVLTGQECLQAGLLGEIVPSDELHDAGLALVARIASQDPLAVRLSKALFHAPRDSHPLIDTIAQAVLFESPEKFDRMQRFLDR